MQDVLDALGRIEAELCCALPTHQARRTGARPEAVVEVKGPKLVLLCFGERHVRWGGGGGVTGLPCWWLLLLMGVVGFLVREVELGLLGLGQGLHLLGLPKELDDRANLTGHARLLGDWALAFRG